MEYKVADEVTADHSRVIAAAREARPSEYIGDMVWETKSGDNVLYMSIDESAITVIACDIE